MAGSVLIIDDHQGFADTLASLLTQRGWGPVTAVSSGDEALVAMERRRPDIITVGLVMSEGDGFDVVRRLRSRYDDLAIVVLTASNDSEQAVRCIRAGAAAFVPKMAPSEDLLAALDAVMGGGAWLPPELLGPILQGLLKPPPTNEWELRLAALTARERQILELMVDGLDRPEIARRLVVSLNTVRTHTRNTLAKLGVHSSLEAVSVALRAGLRPTVDSS